MSKESGCVKGLHIPACDTLLRPDICAVTRDWLAWSLGSRPGSRGECLPLASAVPSSRFDHSEPTSYRQLVRSLQLEVGSRFQLRPAPHSFPASGRRPAPATHPPLTSSAQLTPTPHWSPASGYQPATATHLSPTSSKHFAPATHWSLASGHPLRPAGNSLPRSALHCQDRRFSRRRIARIWCRPPVEPGDPGLVPRATRRCA